jgi:hypothetical protein
MIMCERHPIYEQYRLDEIFCHDVFGSVEDTKRVDLALKRGTPFFCLYGRATLNLGQSVIGPGFEGCLVFIIPKSDQKEVIEPIHKTDFEPGDKEQFPTFYALAQRVPKEFKDDALKWLQYQRDYYDPNKFYQKATIDDIRMIDPKYYIGVID